MSTLFYTTNAFKEALGTGTIDLSGDTFKIMLLGVNGAAESPAYQPASYWAVATDYDSISEYELAPDSGYIAGGKALAGVTYSSPDSLVALKKWDANDVTWSGLNLASSNGQITGFAIYDVSVSDTIVCVAIYDTPISFAGTQNYKIAFSSNGIMRI